MADLDEFAVGGDETGYGYEDEEDNGTRPGTDGHGGQQAGAGSDRAGALLKTSVTGPALPIYALDSYGFGAKDALIDKDRSIQDRLMRQQRLYSSEGMLRTVEGVMLVHKNRHPHILLMQYNANSPNNSYFKLPGGRLKPGEDDIDGLKRKLKSKLSPTIDSYIPKWEVGELLCNYWRPNLDDTTYYPYLPPHVTKPKECKRIFVVQLPEKCYFCVPKNLKLLAVPLFEIYDNSARYGPAIAALPHLLGRFNISQV